MSTKRWVGNASATFDLWTVSLSGTVTSQTYTMTINGKNLSYTSTGGDTVATVLTALAAVWNSTSNPVPPPEFQELTATAFSTTMTLTGDTLGKPSVISVATGGAATFTITNTTPCTGPNDFANGQNWTGGVAPVNSDVLVFDSGAIPCKYGLSTALTGITLDVLPGYVGTIGLPAINSDNTTTTYAEYRATGLTLAGGTAVINAPNCTRCNLAFGAHLATVEIIATGKRPDKTVPTVLITGGNSSSTLVVTKGDYAVAFYTGQAGQFLTAQSAFQTNSAQDVIAYYGVGATLATVLMNGGNVTINSNVTTLTEGLNGGILTVNAGAITTLNVQGGICYYSSTGALGTANVSGTGILDFSQDPAAKTVTNPIQVYGDLATVNDPMKVVNSGTLSVTSNQTAKINVSHGGGSAMTFA